MIDFGTLRVKNIQGLLLTIQQANIRDRSYIQHIYSQSCENYNTTLSFLEEIGVLLIEGRNIAITPQSHAIFNILTNSDKPLDILRSFLIQQLLNKHNSCSTSVNEFLSRFTLHDDKALFIPDYSENIHFADLRNFLMDLGLVEYDHKRPQYLLRIDNLPPATTPSKLSPSLLYVHNRNCEELGHKAELAILSMEQERLSHFPDLVTRIDHVASKDVSAGYDILSYEIPVNNDNIVPRYIEVKAVSQWDMEFYWTSLEIKVACEKKELYWLYLLPVGIESSFLISYLKIINNPYTLIFEANSVWGRECKAFKFWPINSLNATSTLQEENK